MNTARRAMMGTGPTLSAGLPGERSGSLNVAAAAAAARRRDLESSLRAFSIFLLVLSVLVFFTPEGILGLIAGGSVILGGPARHRTAGCSATAAAASAPAAHVLSRV